MLFISALFILFNFIVQSHTVELPSFIHVCHRDDENLHLCMMAAIEDLRPFLVTGVPEYHIPSLEPLILNGLISEEVSGMHIVTSNVSAYGCSDFFVRDISVDWDTNKFTLDIDLPKLRILAHYKVDGKLLMISVRGNGDMEANITDCVSKTLLTGEIQERDGEKYLKFVDINLKVKVGGGTVKLNNLFNGDKILLGMVNDVVNKNLDLFLKELMPAIETSLSSVFLDIANKVVEAFTYKQLFPH